MSHQLTTTTTESFPTLAALQDAIKNGNGPMSFDQRTELLSTNKLTVNPDDTTQIAIEIVPGTDDTAPEAESAEQADQAEDAAPESPAV